MVFCKLCVPFFFQPLSFLLIFFWRDCVMLFDLNRGKPLVGAQRTPERKEWTNAVEIAQDAFVALSTSAIDFHVERWAGREYTHRVTYSTVNSLKLRECSSFTIRHLNFLFRMVILTSLSQICLFLGKNTWAMLDFVYFRVSA
ncbi:unnamed protein product [Albugo candida]|uniref:Uncharacterized protein n=1 Tax=Albugo candida TaxID=65357 RepID=A0A024GGY7_9STRA|nr:unnamed protein product [Albugo candida]|eukprot:CCI45930.1 unnamed protein product [Albugo candida]